jgi:hypothetical protein
VNAILCYIAVVQMHQQQYLQLLGTAGKNVKPEQASASTAIPIFPLLQLSICKRDTEQTFCSRNGMPKLKQKPSAALSDIRVSSTNKFEAMNVL